MKNYKELYENLLKEFRQYKLESIKWGVKDFTSLEVDGQEISEENAQIALTDMIRHHDCNNGITWDTIDYYFSKYSNEVEEGKEAWNNDNDDNE